MTDLLHKTADILKNDPFRMKCLEAARKLDLPDWYLGAGFLRNAIWDHLHQKEEMTPLNDVDLVYFDSGNTSQGAEAYAMKKLAECCPGVVWEVKNQARMHERHGHKPYRNTSDGIAQWVEVPTCVGVRLTEDNQFEFTAPFGLEENWSLEVKINPDYPRPESFRQRVTEKQWQKIWPQLHCIFD